MAIANRQFIVLILLSLSIILVSAEKELKLLHVLAVNKFYVPDYDETARKLELPKYLNYEYFVNKSVDIPNKGKMDLYQLGSNLRQDYELFLGPLYLDGISKMQTTGFPVSIMAGELINAGLWPPVGPQVWNEDLAWQPIPFDYRPVFEDTTLLGTLCPRFQEETELEIKSRNLSSSHAQLLSYLNANLNGTNVNITSLLDIPLLYFVLDNSVVLKQALPGWANKVYPNKDLLNATLAAYELLTETKLQKLLNGGSLLKTILKDSNDYINRTLESNRKINVYSGDDRIFAGVLKNLGIPLNDIPDSAGALVFELYEEGKNHSIKILYYTGKEDEKLPITLDGCDMFCPIDKFSEYLTDVLMQNEDNLCRWKSESTTTEDPKEFGVSSTQNIIEVSTLKKPSSSMGLVVSNALIAATSMIIVYTSTKVL